MKESVNKYYGQGYNCCQAIIMAAGCKYKLNISKDLLRSVSCINNGMGVGTLCGTVIGGIMVIGLIFEKKPPPEYTQINHIRMKFIDAVNQKFGAINCSQIVKLPEAKGNCQEVINIITQILDSIIEEFI